MKSSDGPDDAWVQFNPTLVQSLHAYGLHVCAWQFVYGADPLRRGGAGCERRGGGGADCLVIDAESLAARDIDCTCAAGVRRRYLSRISGPLMDRIDIRVDLPAVDLIALSSGVGPAEPSSAIAERVRGARDRAAFRWREQGWATNAEATGPEIRRQWRFGARETALLDRAARLGRLTGRGYDRVLRLALTSADLAARARPSDEDVASALALRCGEAA